MTTNHQDLTQVSFHEATIVDIFRNGSTVNLTLDDVCIAGVQMAAQVVIEGVSATLRDGSPVDVIRMEKADSEILTLRREGGEIKLAVQWNDFAANNQGTVVHRAWAEDRTAYKPFCSGISRNRSRNRRSDCPEGR
jgi:hypothetical protein